jgi:hypothetical protein
VVHNSILHKVVMYKSWFDLSRCSDHFPIVLELDLDDPCTRTPFKFNLVWSKEEELMNLVKENWVPFDPSS